MLVRQGAKHVVCSGTWIRLRSPTPPASKGTPPDPGFLTKRAGPARQFWEQGPGPGIEAPSTRDGSPTGGPGTCHEQACRDRHCFGRMPQYLCPGYWSRHLSAEVGATRIPYETNPPFESRIVRCPWLAFERIPGPLNICRKQMSQTCCLRERRDVPDQTSLPRVPGSGENSGL